VCVERRPHSLFEEPWTGVETRTLSLWSLIIIIIITIFIARTNSSKLESEALVHFIKFNILPCVLSYF